MTTQTSFSEKNKGSANRRFFNGRYFRFSMKTGWPLIVVFAFVFILSLAVPTVSYVGDCLHRIEYNYDTFASIREDAVEFLYTLGVVNVVISMGAGLLCGLTEMRFTNNKVAVNFYHSLPMRREAIFITSTLRSFVCYISAFAGGLLFTYAVTAVRLCTVETMGMFVRPVLLTLFYGVLFFLLVYAMTLFAASLTGTGFMRFIGTAYVVFLPLAMFALFIVAVGSCGIYNSILHVEYYLSEEFCTLLCAPLRLLKLAGNNETGDFIFKGILNKDTAIVAITALVLYGLAFLLYCLRASESASKPVIWAPARFVFKYSSIFMAGTLFALLFYGMFESVAWMIFGIIIGSVIVFMLTNGILHKSARAIFKGLKGFGIFMAVMAVITVVFYCDVFGMFSTIPDGSFVRRVEVCADYTIEAEYGGDYADRVTRLIQKTIENDDNYLYNNDGIITEDGEKPVVEIYTEEFDGKKPSISYTYAGYEYQSMPVEAVFHTKLGIPYAVRIFPTCEAAYDLIKFMYDTGKVDTSIPEAEQIDSGYIEVYLDDYNEYYSGDAHFSRGANSTELVKYAGVLSDPFGLESDSPIVGRIELYVESDEDNFLYYNINRQRTFYIHANDYAVLNEIADGLEKPFESEDDVIDYFIEKNGIKGYSIVDNHKSERITVTDTDTVREIARSLWTVSRYYNNMTLCERDHRYNLFTIIDGADEYYYNYNCHHFRKGAVPATVTGLFGE